jgi:hypothetical protein
MYGKFWRFKVAEDPSIGRFAIRDCDSRLNSREKAAVDEWLTSSFSFHIMRDSIHHNKHMHGGMWGGIGGRIKNMQELVDGWGRYHKWGDNDEFVAQRIYPLVAGDCLVHDSWGHFPDARPFPQHTALDGTSYVGEIVPIDRSKFDVWRRVGELEDQLVKALTDCESAHVLLRSQDEDITNLNERIAALLERIEALNRESVVAHAKRSISKRLARRFTRAKSKRAAGS